MNRIESTLNTRSADFLGYLGAAFDRGEDLRVKPVDLTAQIIDL